MRAPALALGGVLVVLAAALRAWWAAAGGERAYEVRGRVARFGDGTVFVEHEEVPGYMPAMTMPFTARRAAELEGLEVGDAVAFRLVVGPERSWIEGVERLPGDAVPVHPAGEDAPGLAAGPLLERGGPDVRLTDQDGGHRVRPTSLGGASPVRPGALVHPTSGGPVSSPFGWRQHPVSGRPRHHDGVDLAVPLGTPVRAVADGRVRAIGRRRGYGLVVEVDHTGGGPARSLYAHLSAAAALRQGDRVARGQVVGESGGAPGRDGVSTGPHLHVELRDASGRPLDPARLLPGLAGHAAPRAAAPRAAALPAGFRYRTAADERAMSRDGRPDYARRDTVDIWPTAGPPPRGTERLPDVALPDYPDSGRPAAAVGALESTPSSS